MIRRLFALFLFSTIIVGNSAFVRTARSANPEPCIDNREAWLKPVFERMQTVKPGMTRWDLLKVFRSDGRPQVILRAEGGPPPVVRETFVSQDCSYFKIDVEFTPVTGRDSVPNRDVITKISKPYVQFSGSN